MGVCNVFNIERFATEDGRGIRTVIFLKGCSLRCRWCANPESQRAGAEVLVKTNVCINCARCSVLCPEKSHKLHGKVMALLRTRASAGNAVCASGSVMRTPGR